MMASVHCCWRVVFFAALLLSWGRVTWSQIPDQVANVRAFTFRPNTNTSVITALVTWGEVDGADRYVVRVLENGIELTNLYSSPFPDTSFVILRRDANNGMVSYLETGHTYQVEVTATNEAGSGIPSNMVEFSTNGPNYPQQLLTVGNDGSQFLGSSLGIIQNPSIPEPGPVAVDTIGQTVYWYSPSANIINSRSLQTGNSRVFLAIPNDRVILSLAFDWIGQYLYMLRLNTANQRIEVYKALVFDSNQIINVFESLVEIASMNSTFQLVVNPFTGFLYWTQSSQQQPGVALLRKMDLREPNSTLSSMVELIKSQGSAVLSISSAVAQDPLTGDLLMSDSVSGSIYRCPDLPRCTVEVDRTTLTTSGGMAVVGDVGLPATSLALNEERLYWARSDSPGVYAVDLAARNTLIVISETAAVSSINTLSPGQQIIPAEQECLSPDFLNQRPEFLDDATVVTSSSIAVSWQIVAVLPQSCRDVVFSIPVYTYTLEYELILFQPIFTTFTRTRYFTFTELLPNTEYQVRLSITNMYTGIRFPGQTFHTSVSIMTTAAVSTTVTAGSTDAIGTTDSTLASSGDSNAEAIVGVVLSAVAVLALF